MHVGGKHQERALFITAIFFFSLITVAAGAPADALKGHAMRTALNDKTSLIQTVPQDITKELPTQEEAKRARVTFLNLKPIIHNFIIPPT